MDVGRTLWNLEFLDRCSKDIQISNFLKIGVLGAELFHAHRRTDRYDEVDSHFSKFCEIAQNFISPNLL